MKIAWIQRMLREHEPEIRDFRYTMRLIRRSPLTMLGVMITAGLILMAVFAPWIATQDPMRTNLANQLRPPSWENLFGTDSAGRDIFSRVVYGARLDLFIGVVILGLSMVSGTVLGLIAGFYGGKIETLIMRIVDIFMAVPALILAMAITVALGARSLENVLLAMSIVWWPTYARLVRGEVLSVREREHVEAARSLGAGDLRIMFREILPNTFHPIIVNATLDLGYILLTAASLSFIGFGAQPGVPEWGRMVTDGAEYISYSPWVITFPGLALFISVLGLNLAGDGLRDVLDPRLRR
jgi:peptide/nickel transport system permease protein